MRLTRFLHPAACMFLFACGACTEGRGAALSIVLEGAGAGSASFTIHRQDLYSISYRCAISDMEERPAAWRSIEAMTRSKEWTPEVDIAGGGARKTWSVRQVEDPKLSSWNAGNLYVEFARVELAPGRYELRHDVPLPMVDSPCENSLVVTPAYAGK